VAFDKDIAKLPKYLFGCFAWWLALHYCKIKDDQRHKKKTKQNKKTLHINRPFSLPGRF
jgi:hypothetical protein